MANYRKECHGKVKHNSRGKAEAALRSLVRKDTDHYDINRLNVYPCIFCQFWHVGHLKQNAHVNKYRG